MQTLIQRLEDEIYGQGLNVRLLVTAMLAGGHVLLEGAPGLGKTKLVRTLAQLTDGAFKRVQFTPDLMPSDITGNVVFDMRDQSFVTVKGPIFANMLLADEINRTPPKTQAALLEAMEERQVTIQGSTYPLPDPFFVAATQNPVEYEGTYPLPEAQVDRFLFKLLLDYPDEAAERKVLLAQREGRSGQSQTLEAVTTKEALLAAKAECLSVVVEDSIVDYIAAIVRSTRSHRRIRLGASPRAGLAVLHASKAWAYLDGRSYVTPDDVKLVALPALRHRLILTAEAELEGETSDGILRETLAAVQVPR